VLQLCFVRTKSDLEAPSDVRRSGRPSPFVVTGAGIGELKRRLAEVAFGRLLVLGRRGSRS